MAWWCVVWRDLNIPLKLNQNRPWVILIYAELHIAVITGICQHSCTPISRDFSLNFSLMQANFTTLEDLVSQSIYNNRKALSNQTKNDYLTAGFQCTLGIYIIGSYYNFQIIATVAFIVGIALMVVCTVFLKRGLGAIYPHKRSKGFQCPNAVYAEALRR